MFLLEWLRQLQFRNPVLFGFGLLCLAGALMAWCRMQWDSTQVMGINAWIKPIKFFLSIWILCWTMGWILFELREPAVVHRYNIMLVIVMTFELSVICWQAWHGRTSHFNTSRPLYGALFTLMGIAITLFTIWTLFIGLRFFGSGAAHLPEAYRWGIRLGILFFVVFALEGGIMGARLAHTVGAPDGGAGIPVVNWSRQHGDLRVAHFFGMHALQLLPLAGFYITRSTPAIMVLAAVYFLLVSLLFLQAMRGHPFIKLSV